MTSRREGRFVLPPRRQRSQPLTLPVRVWPSAESAVPPMTAGQARKRIANRRKKERPLRVGAQSGPPHQPEAGPPFNAQRPFLTGPELGIGIDSLLSAVGSRRRECTSGSTALQSSRAGPRHGAAADSRVPPSVRGTWRL